MAWRFATWPPRRWPSSVKATTEGVVRAPSALGITSAWPPSIVEATTEFVVPRSIPTAFGIALLLCFRRRRQEGCTPLLTVLGRRGRRSRAPAPVRVRPVGQGRFARTRHVLDGGGPSTRLR